MGLSWNAAYEASTRKLSVAHRAQTRQLGVEGSDRGLHIRKHGGRLSAVNQYRVVRSLGESLCAYGEVLLAQVTAAKAGEAFFAVKVLRKSALTMRQGAETVQQEIASMKEIEHPNCVRMFDVLLAPAVDQIFLVLEYVDGGTSQQRDAKGQPIPLPERTVWSHLRHLVLGLEYLHMHGIIHRDIKPESEGRRFELCLILLAPTIRAVPEIARADDSSCARNRSHRRFELCLKPLAPRPQCQPSANQTQIPSASARRSPPHEARSPLRGLAGHAEDCRFWHVVLLRSGRAQTGAQERHAGLLGTGARQLLSGASDI